MRGGDEQRSLAERGHERGRERAKGGQERRELDEQELEDAAVEAPDVVSELRSEFGDIYLDVPDVGARLGDQRLERPGTFRFHGSSVAKSQNAC